MAGGGRGGTSHLKSEVGAGMGSSRRESMNAHEVADVLAWREKTRASWSACAAYCGRAEVDVRKACEAVLKSAAVAGMMAVSRVAAPVRITAEDAARTPGERARVSLLAALKAGPMTRLELVEAAALSEPTVRRYVDQLVADGSVVRRPARGKIPSVYALAGDALPPDRKAEARQTRAEWRAGFRAKVEAAVSARQARSRNEIVSLSKISRPLVNKVVADMVARGEAASAGFRSRGRGHPEELFVRVEAP